MDPIRQAIDMARDRAARSPSNASAPVSDARSVPLRTVTLDPDGLEKFRIVAHSHVNSQSHYYDMLRTQVLHEMDRNGWRFLAVTSATPGCGKSVTACNLALGISRLPERRAILLDFDLHKPSITKYLGVDCDIGLLDILEGRASLAEVALNASFGRNSLVVVPGSVSPSGVSEWMASQAMAALLQTIKRDFHSHIAIFDLPPMLIGGEVISILPQMDAVLLIASAGVTTANEIQECRKHLKSTPIMRIILNRMEGNAESYYGYGYRYRKSAK
jgi:Mrp family chromosome partitioning ATPase